MPTVLVGWWANNQVSQSIRQATQNELAGVADSVSISGKRFLDDQARLAESWTRQPDLRDAILALIETPEDDDFVERLRTSPHAAEIRSQLIALSEREDINYVVWERTGTIIASWLPDGADSGSDVSPDGAANLNRAGRGETVLFGPEILRADTNGFQPETNRPVMAEIMPIRNESGRIVATMLIRGFGMYDNFDAIFRQASEAGGLDVYAVSGAGVMVSNSPQAMQVFEIPRSDGGGRGAVHGLKYAVRHDRGPRDRQHLAPLGEALTDSAAFFVHTPRPMPRATSRQTLLARALTHRYRSTEKLRKP